MERMYREHIRRRSVKRMQMLALFCVGICMLLVAFLMSDNIMRFLVQRLLEGLQPSVIRYCMKEEDPVIEVVQVTKKNPTIEISYMDTLQLLQENIYVSEERQKPQEVVSKQVELSPMKMKYDFNAYHNVADLVKDFYIIDESTSMDSTLLDIEQLLAYDCTLEVNANEPQILIYHSHSQEAFADSVPGDESTTIVGAGERLTSLLEAYGYQVLHHKGQYDVPSRDDAYSKALPAIQEILNQNPSIEVVIDLHRDAVTEGTKLVHTIDGKQYAKFMFFNGLCRGTNGPITYLNNPYLRENLAFSFRAQVAAESYFEGITRKIYLKAWRYNMHLRPRNMLIELGAQTNTVEEVMNTCEILAFVIHKVLSGQ